MGLIAEIDEWWVCGQWKEQKNKKNMEAWSDDLKTKLLKLHRNTHIIIHANWRISNVCGAGIVKSEITSQLFP